jgi:hypothetical protein
VTRHFPLPANAAHATTVVIGIESGWQYDASGGYRHRTVYAYWHGPDLPERTAWVHHPLEGNVLWTVGRVANAVMQTAPEARLLFSSSVDFPDEGTEDDENPEGSPE